MITVSYKDGVWKHVTNFPDMDQAHAYAKSEGYTEYKLSKSDRPMGVYYNTLESLENAPSVAQPTPETTPEEILYETPITDEPQEPTDNEPLERVIELDEEPEEEPEEEDDEPLPGLYRELPNEDGEEDTE